MANVVTNLALCTNLALAALPHSHPPPRFLVLVLTMEPLLVDTFQNIIDDTLTFSTVCYHFLHYNVPKRHLSEVCALLLEGDDSWESWLFENAPSELLKRLHENPLGLVLPPEVSYDNEDYEPSTITAFINHIRVMSLSVACDLAMLPFWALKVNHIAGTFRTEELAELVKSNMDKSSAANKDSVLPFMPFMVASRSANIFEQVRRARRAVQRRRRAVQRRMRRPAGLKSHCE